MEIKQLETFVCVAKLCSFSKAAEEMYVSQPTASAHISALEKTLNVQLFVRSTKEVSLTAAGRDFLVYAQRLLALRDQALDSVRGQIGGARGSIDIIASTIPAQHLLPELIAAFHETRPHVVFRVEQADSERVEREMQGFRYDFGLTGTAPDGARFVSHPVCEDELVLVVPRDTPRDDRSIRDDFAGFLREQPLIMREAGSGTRAEIEQIFAKLGVRLCDLRIPAYFPDAHGILSAVGRGLGVSLVSKVAAALYADAGLLRAIDMKSPLFRRQIYLLYNKELWLSPVQQAFFEHVRGYYPGR